MNNAMPVNTLSVAVVGAANLLGETFLEVLGEKALPFGQIHALGQDSDADLSFRGDSLWQRDVAAFDFGDVDLVFVLDGSQLPEAQRDEIRRAGTRVIDLTGSQADAPFVVPELNGRVLRQAEAPTWVNCPDPYVTLCALVLDGVHRQAGLSHVHFIGYRPAAEFGHAGLEELSQQTRDLFNHRDVQAQRFADRLAYNLLPSEAVAGWSEQLQEVLDVTLAVSQEWVTVPLFFGAAGHLHWTTRQPLSMPNISAIWQKQSDRLQHLPGKSDIFATPMRAAGQDAILVAEPREIALAERSCSVWLAFDSLRRGSVGNAMQIAEIMIENDLA